jgi:hypothetical protein
MTGALAARFCKSSMPTRDLSKVSFRLAALGPDVLEAQAKACGYQSSPSALAFPGSLWNKLAHLLFHLRGIAFGAGDLGGLEFLEAHDARKLFPAFDADVFIGGHGSPPDYRGNNSIIIIIGSPGYCKGCPQEKNGLSVCFIIKVTSEGQVFYPPFPKGGF